MRRARRSTRSEGLARRSFTRAMAMPARFSTAAMPWVKKGSGRYLA
jgi:hypothetical protein